MRATPFFVAIFASLAISSGAQARDQISIVGSSTVYPDILAVFKLRLSSPQALAAA